MKGTPRKQVMAKFRLLSVLLSKWPKVQIKHRLLSNLAMYCYSPYTKQTI